MPKVGGEAMNQVGRMNKGRPACSASYVDGRSAGIVIRTMLFAGTSVLTYSYLRRSRSMLNILPRFEPW